jgi:hypothetical protein
MWSGRRDRALAISSPTYPHPVWAIVIMSESRRAGGERCASHTKNDDPTEGRRDAEPSRDQHAPTRQLPVSPCIPRRVSKAELSRRLHLGTLLLHAVQEGQTLITKTLQQAPAGTWAVPRGRRRYVYTQRCRGQRIRYMEYPALT